MSESKIPSPDLSDLRRRAEERLQTETIVPEELSPADAVRLIHEFRVHRIELEMQNEELRLAQVQLEESRGKYADLYDFAPLGYLTLDARGRIVEANLTAANLLGEERRRLTGRFFSHFLAEADRLAFHHLMTGKWDVPEQRAEVRLEDGNGGVRTLLLDIFSMQDSEGKEQHRVAMTDFSELKRTQEELRRHKKNLEGLVAEQVVQLVEVNHQLRQSNAKVQAVIEHSPLAVIHLDNYGRVLSWNHAAWSMFGWRAAEVVGGPSPMVPEEKQEEFAAIFQKILHGESVTGLETRRQRKDGAWIEVSLSAAPLRDAQGNVSGLVEIIEDITARKRAEAEIYRLASFPRLNPNPVMEVDEHGAVVYANPAALSLAEKLQLPEGIKALVPPDLETLFNEVRRGAPRRHSFDLRLKNLTFAVIVHFPHDLPTARLYARDITERQQAEEALRQSEARFRLAQQAAGIGTFEWDMQTGINTWTPELEAMYGLPPGGFGRTQIAWENLVHPDDRLEALRLVDRSFETGEPMAGEWRVVWPDGSIHWLYGRWQVFKDDAGLPVRMTGVNIDVTERKRAEGALRESEARERARAAEFQALFDAMPAFVFLAHDPEARRITGNSLVYDILGMPPGGNVSLSAPAEERSVNYRALKDGREIPIEELPVQRAASGEPVRDYELDVVLTDGARRTLFGNAIPLLDDSGNPRGAVSAFIDITPRKEAEEALLKREAELSSLFAAAPVGIGVVLDRVITEVNERVCQMTGYSPEELLGKSARLFYPTQEEFDRAGQEKYLKIAKHHIGTVETRWQRKDGSIIDVLLSSAPLIPGNISAGVTFTALDITARRQAEEALRQSEARYRALGELIPFGIWTAKSDGATDYVSQSFLKMVDKSLEECLGSGWADLLHPEDRERTLADWRKCIETGCSWDYEHRFRCKEDRYRTILARGVPLTDSQGHITSWVGINLDITERKRAEEELRRARDELELRVQERTEELHLAYDQLRREMAEHLETDKRLRESEALFQAFMRHLPGIAVILDSQGRYLFANEGWESLTGLERSSWKGKTPGDIWPPDLAEKVKKIDNEVLSRGQSVTGIEKLGISERDRDYLFHRFPILDELGRPYMVGSIAVDITERRQAEEALAAERQRLFAVLETIPAYVVLLAPDYTVPFANQEFNRRFGEAGEGQRCFEFLFGLTEPCPDCQAFNVLKTNQPQEWEWLGPDGRTYAVYDYPFTDADGSPLVLEMGVDITERRQAELEAQRQAAIVAGLSRIFREALTCETLEDLGRTCLAVAEELSGSPFGFIDQMNEEGSLDFLAISDASRHSCRQMSKKKKLPTHLVRGLYRSVIEEGTSLIANEPASHPDWQGLPKGHPALASYLGVPLRSGGKVVGQIGLANRQGGYSQRELETLEAVGLGIAEALLHRQAEDALRKSEANMHVLAGQLLDAQEAERRRLSRELHDGLGQSLLVLKFNLSSAHADLPQAEPEVLEKYHNSLELLNNIVDEVRRLSHALSPGPLEEFGFATAVKGLVREFCRQQKISCHPIQVDDIDKIFELSWHANIYRIFQEALANIGKYAGASRISLIVKKMPGRVTFAVQDNGKGFRPAEVRSRVTKGIGLASMQERVRMMGGKLNIWSREGAGTKITFTIPVKAK